MTDAMPDPAGFVVDAALVVKWILPEELSQRAHQLVADAVEAGCPLYACPSLPVEVAERVHARVRDDQITMSEAELAMQLIPRFGVIPSQPANLLSETLRLAAKHEAKRVGDIQAVALARLLDVEVWTGNAALQRSLAKNISWLRWIGDYTRDSS